MLCLLYLADSKRIAPFLLFIFLQLPLAAATGVPSQIASSGLV